MTICSGTKRSRKFRQLRRVDHAGRKNQDTVIAELSVESGRSGEISTFQDLHRIRDGNVLSKLADDPSLRRNLGSHLHDDRVRKDPGKADLIQPAGVAFRSSLLIAAAPENIASPGPATVKDDQVAWHQFDR